MGESRRSLFAYASVSGVALALALLMLRIWRADLHVPFQYLFPETPFQHLNFDVNLYLALIKNLAEGGWIRELPRLGAPGTLVSADYPFAQFQLGEFLLLRLLTGLGLSFGQAVNLFFILSFPMIAGSALYLFRSIGARPPVAAVCAILFAFLPYHVHTGMMHLALGFYVSVPLTIALCLEVLGAIQTRMVYPRDLLRTALFVLIIGFSDVYYASLSIVLFTASAALARMDGLKSWIRGLYLSLAVVGVVVLEGLSVVLDPLRSQGAFAGAAREWVHAEFWGLKVIQLFLPVRGHFFEAFSRLSERYNLRYPYGHVNESVALGFLGSVGFLFLLAQVFRGASPASPGRDDEDHSGLLRACSRLNLAALLIATVGGFGTLFAFAVRPEIRSFYRMGIYIGALSLIGLMVLLQRTEVRTAGWTKRLLLVGVLGFGVLDQTGRLAVPWYRETRREFVEAETTFARIEAQVPAGAMILQLPHVPFPEGGGRGGAKMYEQFVPFLHTVSLRWSYGAHRAGRIGRSIESLSSSPAAEVPERACKLGFSGVLLDRKAYEGAETELRELEKVLSGSRSLAAPSGDAGRYVFHRLQCEERPASDQGSR